MVFNLKLYFILIIYVESKVCINVDYYVIMMIYSSIVILFGIQYIVKKELLFKIIQEIVIELFLGYFFKENILNRGVRGCIVIIVVVYSLFLENKMVMWVVLFICLTWFIYVGVSGFVFIFMLGL